MTFVASGLALSGTVGGFTRAIGVAEEKMSVRAHTPRPLFRFCLLRTRVRAGAAQPPSDLEKFRDYLGVLVRVQMDSYHRQSTQWQGGIARLGLNAPSGSSL